MIGMIKGGMIERWDDRKCANGMIEMTDRPTELRRDDKRWDDKRWDDREVGWDDRSDDKRWDDRRWDDRDDG